MTGHHVCPAMQINLSDKKVISGNISPFDRCPLSEFLYVVKEAVKPSPESAGPRLPSAQNNPHAEVASSAALQFIKCMHTLGFQLTVNLPDV